MSAREAGDLRAAIADPLDRILAAAGGAAALREVERGAFPARLWAEVEALGLGLLLVPEAAAGAGLGWTEASAVFLVLGRHGAPVPLAEAMLANRLLGEARLVRMEGLPTVEAGPGGGWAWGRHARWLVAAEDGGVTIRDAGRVAWERGANIGREPRDAAIGPPPLVARGASDSEAAERALLAGALTRALTITGAASAVLEMTVDYANTRRQFNRPIGRFQAIQHLVAQAAGEVAICRAAAESAAAAADRLSLPCAAPEIAAAKVIAGEAATTVAQVAHAVHGAIGITDDHVLHHLTRRLWSWREEFGTERHWAARLGRKALAAGAGHWEWLTARDALGR